MLSVECGRRFFEILYMEPTKVSLGQPYSQKIADDNLIFQTGSAKTKDR